MLVGRMGRRPSRAVFYSASVGGGGGGRRERWRRWAKAAVGKGMAAAEGWAGTARSEEAEEGNSPLLQTTSIYTSGYQCAIISIYTSFISFTHRSSAVQRITVF